MTPSLPPPSETRAQAQAFAALWIACWLGTAIVVGLLTWRDGVGVLGRLLGLFVSAQVIGKWVIFAGANANNPYRLNPWELAALISVFDLWIGIGLNTFLPQLEKLPRVGLWIRRTRQQATTTFLAYPRLKHMAFWGVVLWVLLPLPASGAITGSFVTRLSGLSRVRAVAAIAIGSAANGLLFAALAAGLGAHGEALLNNRTVTLVGSLAFVALVWWLWRYVRRLLQQT